MRIENNYFAEDLKEGNVPEEIAAPEAQPARASDPEFVTWFVKSLAESRASTRAQKRLDGDCLPMADFERLAELADGMAAGLGLDFLAESADYVGHISLTGRKLELYSREEPERIDALAQIVARADRLYFETVRKYGLTLVRLAVYYDLDE